jgi:hypothetical protein
MLAPALVWLWSSALALDPGASTWGTATLLAAREQLGLRAFVTGSPRCPAPATGRATRCIGLHVHVVEVDGEPVASSEWMYADVEHANRLFAEIDVGFTVVAVDGLDAGMADVETRRDRDHLGRPHFSRGVVHVFVVRRLADVDVEGAEIRGVHWRDRADTSRRWVILSAIGSSTVLAHELGHFFGLPHSGYEVSIMNKAPRPTPTWPDRVFHRDEIAKMRKRRDAMLADGMIVDRSR